MSQCYIGVRFLSSRNQISLSETVVSRKAHHGFVTADLHDGQHINPRSAKIRNRGMAEVVEAEVRDLSRLTRRLKGTLDRTDWPIPM